MNEKKKNKLDKKSIYSCCAGSRPSDDGNDIVVCEILSRLPVKSLMRFKCVCKHWRDLIQEYPYFIDLHLTRSKTLAVQDRFDVFKDDDMFPTYQFGFDPATKEYKVLCVWSTGSKEVCEVLTVGQTKWRRVRDEIPSNNFYDGNSVYANGCIYWIVYECLTVFDVGNEKFKVILVPNCISDQPRDCGQNVELLDDQVDKRADLLRRMSVYEGQEVGLLEIGVHITVFRRMNDYTVKLWIFNEDTQENTSNECWSELTIVLPFCWAGDGQCVYIHTVPGTDQIIFETYRDCLDRRIEYASLYSYN